MRLRRFRAALLAAPAALLVSISAADAQGGPPRAEGWSLSVGFAPAVTPIYSGADDYGLSIFPDIRVAYGERFAASVPEGASYRVINDEFLRAGPIARIRFGREAGTGGSPFLITGESDDLFGFEDIDTAGEIGAFAEIGGRTLSLRGEMRQGFGGHDGLVGDISAAYRTRTGALRISAGPRATIASSDFVNVYYGVDAAASAASGLPAYTPGGGLVSVGVGATAVYPLTDRSSLAVIAGYDRIMGDAADSPLVRDRGDADQASLIFAYSWRLFGGVRR